MGVYVPLEEWADKEKRTFTTPDTKIPVQVEKRFDKCEEFAQKAFNNSQDFVNDLDYLLSDLEIPGADLDYVFSPYVHGLSYEDRPSLGNIDLADIPANTITAPTWGDIPSFDPVEFPSFNIVAPEVHATKPDHAVINDPGEPSPIATVTYPAKPDIDIPTAPVLEDIAFPAAPSITIPGFDGELPTEVWDMPENFSYTEADYGSDIWADLLAKVLNDIRNGGTGLGALVEEELYDRALARQETENERLYQEVENYFEARGFTLPVGAMAGRLFEAAREVSRNNTEINSKIMIDQAQLAQTNTHFMIDKGIQLEGMLRDFFNAQANRAFEAAKVIASVGIEIFNANVNKFNAKVQAYQTQAAVYESKIKAALTQAEIYKAQIDACSVMSDVQKNLVLIYSEKIKVLDTIVKVYSAEMEAVGIKAEVEKTKIEIFRAQVQAYVARIEADKAKFESYGIELEGEKTKALIYSEQVKGFLGKVEAAKAESDIQLQTSELALKSNLDKTNQYKAMLSGYETEIKAITSENATLVDGFKTETMAYSAETEAEGIKLASEIKLMDVSVSAARFKLDRAIAEVNAALDGFKAVKELQVAGTKGIMDVGAQLAASAMNAINANASLGFAQQTSEGETWGHHESMNESHPYEEVATAEAAPE